MGTRDSFCQRVYDAEDSVLALCHEDYYTIAQAQAWINRFIRSKWCKRRWGKLDAIPVEFAPRVTAWKGSADVFGITLAPRALDRPYIVIHELAHVITDRLRVREASHGPIFLRVLVALVGRFVGKRAMLGLLAALAMRNVPM